MKLELSRTCDEVGCMIKLLCETPADEIVHGLLESNQDKLKIHFDYDSSGLDKKGCFTMYIGDIKE